MLDRRTYLKVKIKSLAAEARIIRQEEKKARGHCQAGLTNHRRIDVRGEARLSQLAYGFLRGRPYEALERNAKPFDQKRFLSLVDRFGPVYDNETPEEWAVYQERLRDTKQRAQEWVAAALKKAA